MSEKVALQLAGLQAQVALGDPNEDNKLEYYTDIDTYLPYRISKTRGDDVWVRSPFSAVFGVILMWFSQRRQ